MSHAYSQILVVSNILSVSSILSASNILSNIYSVPVSGNGVAEGKAQPVQSFLQKGLSEEKITSILRVCIWRKVRVESSILLGDNSVDATKLPEKIILVAEQASFSSEQ